MRTLTCCTLRALLLLLALQVPTLGTAQSYPSKPVRVIIPTAPGDGCDLLSRLVAAKLGERLRWQFTIDNRPGAAQQLGLQLLAQSPPDGYTIGCGQSGNLVLVPHTYKKVPYDTFKDFVPIALLGSNFLAVVVHPTVPFKTIKDLVAYAKANPGKLTFGNTGEGAFLHFATELLSRDANFTYLAVPFKSTTALITDIIGGRIDAMVGPFNTIQPYAAAGRLKLLGIARETRAPNYPDIPTIAESIPGYTSGGWFGLVAPAAVPRDTVALLNREIANVMKLPEVREKTASLELEVHAEPPEFFAEVIRRDFTKWGKLAKDIGYKPQ